MKISWLKIAKQDKQIASIMYNQIGTEIQEDLWRCNLSPVHVCELFEESFWRDVLRYWSQLNFQKTVDNPKSQMLWLNSHILIEGKPVIWMKQYNKGLKTIAHLYDDERLISVRKAYENFGLSWMEFHMLVSAIPMGWRKNHDELHQVTLYDQIISTNQTVRRVYVKLQNDRGLLQEKYVTWRSRFEDQIDYEEFIRAFTDIYSITNIPKLRSFQYRLLQNALVLNTQLKKWGVMQQDTCTFCQEEAEDLLHIFVKCPCILELWKTVSIFAETISEVCFKMNAKGILLNQFAKPPRNVDNFIGLVTKQFIYRKRCAQEQLNFVELRNQIYQNRNFEKYYAMKNNHMSVFQKKWNITLTSQHEEH